MYGPSHTFEACSCIRGSSYTLLTLSAACLGRSKASRTFVYSGAGACSKNVPVNEYPHQKNKRGSAFTPKNALDTYIRNPLKGKKRREVAVLVFLLLLQSTEIYSLRLIWSQRQKQICHNSFKVFCWNRGKILMSNPLFWSSRRAHVEKSWSTAE